MKNISVSFTIIVFLGVIMVTSCITPKNIDADHSKKDVPIDKTIYATTDMNEIIIEKGESFEIMLDSNPTTGFAWEIAEELDASILEEVDNVYGSNNTDNNDNIPMVGVGGKEVWTFKALKKGEATIKMKYCQSFNANNPAEERSILVKIQ
jgi:inhibitor of cysteine peptidase